jgi:transcriptional regulator with XRE-family HTH domain
MKNKNTPENENTTLGYRIRTAREKAGIYQGKLAEMLGLTSGRIISNWENNVARPDADNIAKLCRALNHAVGHFLPLAHDDDVRRMVFLGVQPNIVGRSPSYQPVVL